MRKIPLVVRAMERIVILLLEQINKSQPENSSASKVYTVKEIAVMLKLEERTAYHICKTTKDFKVIRVGQRMIRIDKQSFDNWFSAE